MLRWAYKIASTEAEEGKTSDSLWAEQGYRQMASLFIQDTAEFTAFSYHKGKFIGSFLKYRRTSWRE